MMGADIHSNIAKLVERLDNAARLDDMLPELGREICRLLNADRLILYVVSDDGGSIVSRLKMGLDSFTDIKLPISASSHAGYAALTKKTLNIADAYDQVKHHSGDRAFFKAVDLRTGYRSRQMLIAPILGGTADTDLLGVLQLINNLGARPFSAEEEEGLVRIAQSFAKSIAKSKTPSRSKYEYLVTDNVIAAGELELAIKAARRKNQSVERILIDEFQVKLSAIGTALAKFFGVGYEAFNPDRVTPPDLLQNITRAYAEATHWFPVGGSPAAIAVIATDPEQVKSAGVVEKLFPGATVTYKVTTERDFSITLDRFFGGEIGAGSESIGDLLSSLDDEDVGAGAGTDEVSAAADHELVKFAKKIIVDAHNQGAWGIQVGLSSRGKARVLFLKKGNTVESLEIPGSYHDPLVRRLKSMSGLDVSERSKSQKGKVSFKELYPLDIEVEVMTQPTAGDVEDISMLIWPAQDKTIGMSAVRAPPSPASQIPVPITDDVYFTVTAPKTVAMGRQFVLDVWAHLQKERAAVLMQAAEEAAGKAIRSKTKGAARIEQGKTLAVHVKITDFGFSATDSILWTGTKGNATFAVTVPDNATAGSHIGTVTFAIDGIQISRLHFELEVGLAEGVAGERKVRERRPSSAFASYASEDRDRVLGRIQGMQKLLPDLDIFLDIASIRSGEDWSRRLEEEIARRETFYLFWSLAASRSEWVEKEWRAALRLKGIENIDPVPLEPPQKAPPPAELASLHFNEWTLAFQER